MTLPIQIDDVSDEENHYPRTKPLSSPTFDGDIGLDNGVFAHFSSQHSRTLNNRTGGSSSHGDGPHGDELGGSETSDEALSVLGKENTALQDELDLLPAGFGTLDGPQELQQGEGKLTDDPPEPLAPDQASSSSGDRGDETDVTKKSTTDKSYVPSSGYASPKPTGKRKLASSMRGLSQMNTRSRTRREDIGDDNSSPTNSTQAEPVRAGGVESSKKKKPAASHKRVAKKPFGSDKTGLEPDKVLKKPSTKLGASRVRGSKSESPGNLSSASSNRQQYTACKNAASSAAIGKAPGMSIYDVVGSPEPEKPASRKTAAKGRSKKRTAAASAPTATGQTQPAKKAANRRCQAPAGPKSQAKSQENKQLKPLQTYGRAVAEEVVDGSSPERTTFPNSKRRRNHTSQETTDRPFKKLKAEDDTKVSPVQDEPASSAPGKVHIITSDDVDDRDGDAEHEGAFNLRPNSNFPRTQCHALSPVELGMSAQDESTQRLTIHGAIQWVSAKDHRLLRPAITGGQKQNDAPRATADLGDMRAPLPLQVVSDLPRARRHSSILPATSTKPISTAPESGQFPRIEQGMRDLDRSNRLAPLLSGQKEQCLESLPTSTAGQRDDHQSSPYSLHPRSMAFQQELSSMQAAREREQPVSKEKNHIQPQAAKNQDSSQTEAHDESFKGKNRWQAAIDETSQGLADTMHSITNMVLRELTSKEASIDSIVKEYSHNGAMIAANSFRRQQEEHERAMTQLETVCTDISQAFSRATEESMEMQTELSSKMGWLRQLATKRRRTHREIMAMDNAKSANWGVV